MTRNAVRLAARCLIEAEKGGYSNLVLKEQTKNGAAERSDVLFATALFYGALERKLTLDYILSGCVKGGLQKLDAEVRAILRCGLYMSLYMDSTPVYTAINECVGLCAVFKKTSAKGLVNAVLRKAAAFPLASIDSIADERERMSVKYSVCTEIYDMLKAQYGEESKEILASFFERGITAVRVNTLKTNEESAVKALEQEGVTAKTSALKGALIIEKGDWLSSSLFKSGAIRAQSLAAQCAALALGAGSGERVLDMCAAPGGKALTSAQMMENRGEIVALDRYESRVKLIESQARLEGVTIVSARVADAAEYSEGEEFDRVLCDVPCSAYGEIASKPELRYKAPPTDAELTALQAKILRNGARQTKKGGRLVYSTCTLCAKENEEIALSFLSENKSFRAIKPDIPAEFIEFDGKFTHFLPKSRNNEGFFIATFERI